MKVIEKYKSLIETIDAKDLESKDKWSKIGEGKDSEVYVLNFHGLEVAAKVWKDISIDSPQFRKEISALKYFFTVY